LPIRSEKSYASLGEGVFYHLHQHFVGNGSDMSACLGRRNAVQWMTYAGSNHLGRDLILLENLNDIGNKLHTIVPYIVQPPDKRTNIGCPSTRP